MSNLQKISPGDSGKKQTASYCQTCKVFCVLPNHCDNCGGVLTVVPSFRSPEDKEVARQLLLDYSNSLDEESFMLPLDATGLIQRIASALQRKGFAGEEAADSEIRRLQDGIRDHLISLGAPDSLIDGAGCDSGDPLDFTRAEITQAFSYFDDEHTAALYAKGSAEYQRGRDAQRRELMVKGHSDDCGVWVSPTAPCNCQLADVLARLGQEERESK